jgi:hypothetical protein
MKTKLSPSAPARVQKILRKCVCSQCGEPLIFGRWRHYFEYVALTLKESSPRNMRTDKSEGWHLQCSRDHEHNIVGILTDREAEVLYDFVTARSAVW